MKIQIQIKIIQKYDLENSGYFIKKIKTERKKKHKPKTKNVQIQAINEDEEEDNKSDKKISRKNNSIAET